MILDDNTFFYLALAVFVGAFLLLITELGNYDR